MPGPRPRGRSRPRSPGSVRRVLLGEVRQVSGIAASAPSGGCAILSREAAGGQEQRCNADRRKERGRGPGRWRHALDSAPANKSMVFFPCPGSPWPGRVGRVRCAYPQRRDERLRSHPAASVRINTALSEARAWLSLPRSPRLPGSRASPTTWASSPTGTGGGPWGGAFPSLPGTSTASSPANGSRRRVGPRHRGGLDLHLHEGEHAPAPGPGRGLQGRLRHVHRLGREPGRLGAARR